MAKLGATSQDMRTEIAKRAYAIWESEGRLNGRDLEHWLRAESEVGSKSTTRKARGRKPSSPKTKSKAKQHTANK
jgi:hypothetical protein